MLNFSLYETNFLTDNRNRTLLSSTPQGLVLLSRIMHFEHDELHVVCCDKMAIHTMKWAASAAADLNDDDHEQSKRLEEVHPSKVD